MDNSTEICNILTELVKEKYISTEINNIILDMEAFEYFKECNDICNKIISLSKKILVIIKNPYWAQNETELEYVSKINDELDKYTTDELWIKMQNKLIPRNMNKYYEMHLKLYGEKFKVALDTYVWATMG